MTLRRLLVELLRRILSVLLLSFLLMAFGFYFRKCRLAALANRYYYSYFFNIMLEPAFHW